MYKIKLNVLIICFENKKLKINLCSLIVNSIQGLTIIDNFQYKMMLAIAEDKYIIKGHLPFYGLSRISRKLTHYLYFIYKD